MWFIFKGGLNNSYLILGENLRGKNVLERSPDKYSFQVLLIYFSLEPTPVADSSTTECFCESPVDVKFEPCGHAMMCSTCAQRAKKCPQCKVEEYR